MRIGFYSGIGGMSVSKLDDVDGCDGSMMDW